MAPFSRFMPMLRFYEDIKITVSVHDFIFYLETFDLYICFPYIQNFI